VSRVVDTLAVLLLALAAVSFVVGVFSIGERRDLAALVWIAVGALALRAGTEALRPWSVS
jgi:hypothetical protein